MFTFLVVFFSLVLFDKKMDIYSILFVAGLSGVIVTVFTLFGFSTLFFESINLNSKKLIYKYFLGKNELEISMISSIYETIGRKNSLRLCIKARGERVYIAYKAYNENDIRKLVEFLTKNNPEIKNKFRAI